MSQTTQTSLLLLEMVLVFGVAQRLLRLSTVLSLLAAAVAASLTSGIGAAGTAYHVVEGSFTFLHIALIILTGTLFVEVQKESGAFDALVRILIVRLHGSPRSLLVLLMSLVILPGALTGPGAAGVIALGSVVAPVLAGMGIPPASVVAFLALGGVLGDFAPPINIPAMIISSGINMPYVGFFVPLAAITAVLAVGTSLFVGARHVKGPLDLDRILAGLPPVRESMTATRVAAPLLVVAALMVGARALPHVLPPLGVPLMFLAGTAVAAVAGGKWGLLRISRDVVERTLPVVGILIAVGPVVQVMSATGVRGLFVITAITVPIVVAAALFSSLLIQSTGAVPDSPLPPSDDSRALLINLLSAVIVAPIGEEILYRGVIAQAWGRQSGARRAIVFSAIVFAFAHTLNIGGESIGDALAVAGVAFAIRLPLGLALGWLWVRRRSLLATIVLHAAYNAVLVLVTFAA